MPNGAHVILLRTVNGKPHNEESGKNESSLNILDLARAPSCDAALGTLWWVREDLWKERLPGYKPSPRPRLGHPGLSVLQNSAFSSCHMVPLLFGTSGGFGPVVVRDLDPHRPKGSTTSFGNFYWCPAPIPSWEFHQPAPDALWPSQWARTPFRYKRVLPNRHKPRVDDQERRQLIEWAVEKGHLTPH